VVRIEDAIRLAQEADLDLVEVAPNSKPPVAKIMDFGKFKYETAQKAKEAKRNQTNTILKEVRFRLKIDTHDYETKRKRAEGFLQSGDKVKAMILFRGREQSRPEQGVRLLQRFAEDVSEFGSVESTPTIDGRNMVMVIGPLKTKAEVKAEHDSKKPARAPRPEREDVAPAAAPVVAAPVASAPAAPVEETVVEAPVVAPAPEKVAAPAAEAPVAEKPVAEKPVAEKPVAEKPAAETPAAAPKAAPTPAAKPAAAATPKPAAAPKPAATPKPSAAAIPKPAAAPKPAASKTSD
jgi:translation initiation factor IF-3